jgi:hypothetical protein
MPSQNKQAAASRPVSGGDALADARARFDELVAWCQTSDQPFWQFEKQLFVRMAALAVCLLRLFLQACHQRLNVQPYLEDGSYRLGDDNAQRTLKTAYGPVTYARAYLAGRHGHAGFFPLDAHLGLTNDRLSPWMMQWVAQLATRLSFKAAHLVCRAVLNWAPATETIEQVALGLGRHAAPFMKHLKAPAGDGEVLVIEVDGKCPPTATEAELAKRRGKRQPRHTQACRCGCQRHRGKARRQARGGKKRRKKGDKSKNGKEVSVLVMYTLKRGADGLLHGPVNKRIWGTFAGRQAAATWARAEATKRGFGPETTKTVQIVLDGCVSLRQKLQTLFPQAIFTLDICHVVERLWAVGRVYHPEGSADLHEWVDDLKALLYAGEVPALLGVLRGLLRQVAKNGPGTKARRETLAEQIGYIAARLDMMRYGDWLKDDLVIATGQVEGTVRQLVGERFDCAGMRWRREKAEALLHLRCIELNGDWPHFFAWTQERLQRQLARGQRVKVLTDQPLTLAQVA